MCFVVGIPASFRGLLSEGRGFARFQILTTVLTTLSSEFRGGQIHHVRSISPQRCVPQIFLDIMHSDVHNIIMNHFYKESRRAALGEAGQPQRKRLLILGEN